jgi:hypothetical protein
MSLRPRSLPAGFIEPCLPTSTKRLPSGKGWLQEIKHDGFRVIARKDGKRVRLCVAWRVRSQVERSASTVTSAGVKLPHQGSAFWSVGRERVIWIAGIDKVRALAPSSSSKLSTVFPITLAADLFEPGASIRRAPDWRVEALCQHRCNVKQRERLHPE